MSFPDYILITGTSRGFGKALALHFLEKNVKVIGISRTPSDINHNNFLERSIDISNWEYCQQQIIELFDRINASSAKIGVVLSAAKLGENGGIFTSPLYSWESVFKTNVLGNMAVIQGLRYQFDSSGFARIVVLGGGGAAYKYPEFTGYSLSKVALVREVENIAQEFEIEDSNFSIVALAPGAMETKMLEKVKKAGGNIKTTVEMKEPIRFVEEFMKLENNARNLNGRFVHSRDNYDKYLSGGEIIPEDSNLWKLRRIE